MLTLRTILHPSDFSPCSEQAFALACSLARDHGARVIVLHVVSPPLAPYPGPMPVSPQDVLREAREALLKIRASDPGVPVEHRLEEGDAVGHILRIAQEVPCDLIVLGTHGRRAVARLLMGSVAEAVVRKAACPVLTVKTPLPGPVPDRPVEQAPAQV